MLVLFVMVFSLASSRVLIELNVPNVALMINLEHDGMVNVYSASSICVVLTDPEFDISVMSHPLTSYSASSFGVGVKVMSVDENVLPLRVGVEISIPFIERFMFSFLFGSIDWFIDSSTGFPRLK